MTVVKYWFFLVCVVFSTCDWISDWMPDTVFYLVGCWVFLSIYKCSWALYWDAVNLLETIQSVRVALLWLFLDGSGVVLSLRLIVLHVHGKILSTLPIAPKLWVFLVWPLGTGTIPRLVCMTGTVPPNPLGWFFSWARIDFLYACVLLVGPMNSSCVSPPDSADFLRSGHQPARPAVQFAGPSVKWKCRPFVKII